MGKKKLSSQEVIIRELLDQNSFGSLYDLSTLQFLKSHTHDVYQLHWITCNTNNGSYHNYLFLLQKSDDNYWEIDCVFPGLSGELSEGVELEGLPHASLGVVQAYGNLLYQFCAYGEIFDKELSITKVRLISANNVVLEDYIEQGLALFISNERIERPIWVELYNKEDTCINRHELT